MGELASRPSASSRAAESPSRVNILLVDDQPQGLLVLESILGELGQNLVRARSGRDALRQLLAEDFAVILLDVQMPDMDGYETAALIRTRPRSSNTPIIFLTATSPGDVQTARGYSVGAIDYLFKPLDPVVMRSKVICFVELFRATQLVRIQADELRRRELEARELAAMRAGLVATLEDRNLELAALNRELETFSYSVSHDLRAPLRSIDGFSQAVLEDCGDRLDPDSRENLDRVRKAVQRMSQLIDGLLQLSKVTRRELRRDRVDLGALAQGALARLRAQSDRAGPTLACRGDLIVRGDPALLEAVVENLIGNAWKFTGKTDAPRIEIGRTSDGPVPTYYVRDNGAGFDMAHAGKLFGAFQRLHATSDFEGTGIGLATVQRIIHRHGGEIRAEGAPGRGATFYFTLGDAA
jgi:two-component system, sensor histidine kinase and response regulator